MELNKLIYGKEETQRIVNLEVHDGHVDLFVLNEKFDIEVKSLPSKYWLLSNKPLGSNWVRLKGDLHYKYGKQFTERTDLLKSRRKHSKDDTFSIYDAKEACMVNKGITVYKGLSPKDIPILTFDLETTGLDPNTPDSKVLLISNTFRKNGVCSKRLFAYDEYSDEGEMIQAWCDWVNAIDPSILSGHNINCFDIPYLKFRAEIYGNSLNIGRDGSDLTVEDSYESKLRLDGSRDLHYHKNKIYGRDIIDTMFLAYKHDAAEKKYSSYGLKAIIKVEKLEAINRQFYDASQIRFKYKDPVEWAKIKAYCIDDADDALKLFDLMSPSFFYLTQSIPRPFQQVTESASGSWINGVIVRGYLQDRHSVSKATPIEKFEGGISFGIPGIYRNCFKLDIKSAYPSSILIYKLYDKEKDPFAYMLKLCEYFTYQRFEYKKKLKETKDPYYKALDGSAKIFINSIFGFCGASGLNYNSPTIAARITKEARTFLEKGMTWGTGAGCEKWFPRDIE